MTKRRDRSPADDVDPLRELRGVTIDDPHPHLDDMVERPDGTVGAPRLAAMRNISGDVVAKMFLATSINHSQVRAADWFMIYRQRQGDAIGSIDFDRVGGGSGGLGRDNREVMKVDAARQMEKAREWIGRRGFMIVELIVFKGCLIKETAPLIYGDDSQSRTDYLGRRFRDALDELAELPAFQLHY